jgi:hypothetical protein
MRRNTTNKESILQRYSAAESKRKPRTVSRKSKRIAAASSPTFGTSALDRSEHYSAEHSEHHSMDVSKWKESLLNVDTSGHHIENKRNADRPGDIVTPETIKGDSVKKNRWEIAAQLMFKKEQKKKDQDLQNIGQKAKFETHVQRMLLGRVKTRSQKKFDILRQELIMAKQPSGVVAAASKSLAGFRVGNALENMLKRSLRWGFFKWHRLLREARIQEEFQDMLDAMRAQIEYLKVVLSRQNMSIMATVERTMKRKIVERRAYYFRQWNSNMLRHKLRRAQEEQNSSNKRICRRVCLKLLNAKLSSAWLSLREHVRLRKLLDRVGARWLKQSLLRCLNAWKIHTKEFKRLRLVGGRVVKRMLQRKLAAMFDTWSTKVKDSLRMKRVGQKVVKRMLQRKLAAMFDTWSTKVKDSLRMKRVGQKVVKRMLQRNWLQCLIHGQLKSKIHCE